MDDFAAIAQVTLALVFLWSSINKATELGSFARSLPGFAGVPFRLAKPVALLVLALEGGTAALLFTGVWNAYARVGTFALLCLFLMPVARNALRSAPLACNCFGGQPDVPRHRWSLVRLALLFALLGLTPLTQRAPEPATLAAALGLLILGYWVGQLPLLVAMARAPIPSEYPTPRRYSYRASTEARIAQDGS